MLMLLHVSHRLRVKCSLVQVDHWTRPPHASAPETAHTPRDCSQGGPAVLAAFLCHFGSLLPPPDRNSQEAKPVAGSRKKHRWV
ncbi:unnamed protein product [Arctogadus glacialis]